MKNILGLLLVFFCISCSDAVDEDLQTISPVNFGAPLSVDISDLTDSVSYIPLETTPESLLGYIDNVSCDDDYIFVNSNHKLYSFKSDGSFVSQVGRQGRGIGEYSQIDTYFLDRESNRIGIFCSYPGRIIFFEYNGTYIKTVNLTQKDALSVHMIEVMSEDELIVYYNLPSKPLPVDAQYRIIDIADDPAVSYPLSEASELNTGEEGISPFIYSPLVKYKGSYLAAMPLSDRLYQVDEDGAKPRYRVNAMHLLPDKRYVTKYWTGSVPLFQNTARSQGKSIGVVRLFENGAYLFIDMGDELMIWDGDKAMSFGVVSNKSINMAKGALVSGLSKSNMGHYEASFLLDNKEHISDMSLLRILEELDYDSNPVVFLYHFKSDILYQSMDY